MSPATSPTFLLRKPDWMLVALARDGNDAAFGAIVVRYGPELHRHCRRLLRDQRAEDAVQQTFVHALQALRSGTEVRELRAWLYRIARNVALTELGSARRDHAELNDEWEDSARAGEVDSRECLRQALLAISMLPERQRTALLRAAGGENLPVIAEALGISTGAVRQLLHRARVTVRAAAQALFPPPLLWLSRRVSGAVEKIPAPAAVPAGLAPLAPKVAALVIGAAVAVAPATLIDRGHSSSRSTDALAGAFRGTESTGSLEAGTLLGQQGILSIDGSKQHAGGAPPLGGTRVFVMAGPGPGGTSGPPLGGSSATSGQTSADTTATDPTATDASACSDPNDPGCDGSTDTTCTDPNDPSCGGSTDTISTDTTSTDTTSTDTTSTDTTSTASTDTTPTDTTSTDTTLTDTTSTDTTTSTGP